jgi:hypothetical protein
MRTKPESKDESPLIRLSGHRTSLLKTVHSRANQGDQYD